MSTKDALKNVFFQTLFFLATAFISRYEKRKLSSLLKDTLVFSVPLYSLFSVFRKDSEEFWHKNILFFAKYKEKVHVLKEQFDQVYMHAANCAQCMINDVHG